MRNTMSKNPLLAIEEHGQSIWLDNLTRGLVKGGGLRRLLEEDGISGVTSNPAIFNAAMTKGTDYDEQIRALAEKGMPAERIYETMAIEDIQGACDLFRPVYDESGGTDGFVSLEVSPHLARDGEGTRKEARRLWEEVDRPNAFIKIPGTPEGLPAVRDCLIEGININITLLFSLDAYATVMEAHLQALEARVKSGKPLDTVASVASFFLSRIDTKVDKRLDALREKGQHAEEAAALRGKAAIASAKLAYALWKALGHMLGHAGIKTRIRKKDPENPQDGPQDRSMSPAVALKLLHDVQIGDILLESVEGRKLRLRRVARPNPEQAEIIASLGFSLPERICADRDVTPKEFTTEPPPPAAGVNE